MSDMPDGFESGWVDDPVAVSEMVQLQPFATIAATPAGQVQDIPRFVYGWKTYETVVGKPWPSRNQGKVGSCVSFGTAAAIEYTMICEMFRGQDESYSELAQEVIYGGSRVEIGGGKLGNRDGSIGAWAAEFVRRWGVLPREVVGVHDLRQYSEARCREYGLKGVPDDIEPVAKQHPIAAVTKVTTADEARKALASGYGIAVSSSQGFTLRRDEQGFCAPSGTWMHCMAIIGYTLDPKPAFWICNSWGDSTHTGPAGVGNPPPCGFWADASVVGRMLSQGDSWAFADLAGFPAKAVSWVL